MAPIRREKECQQRTRQTKKLCKLNPSCTIEALSYLDIDGTSGSLTGQILIHDVGSTFLRVS